MFSITLRAIQIPLLYWAAAGMAKITTGSMTLISLPGLRLIIPSIRDIRYMKKMMEAFTQTHQAGNI